MKFEIDLNEILGDEYGNMESLAESIRRQVIENLTEKTKGGIKKQIDEEVAKVLADELKLAVKEKIPGLISDLLVAEYRPVDRYGDLAKEPTTFRKELVKEITSQMVYKKTSYSSDRNVFTAAVDSVIAENVKAMQQAFDKTIIEMFQKEAFDYATKQMAKKLGLDTVK
jgi:hypothetical protein